MLNIFIYRFTTFVYLFCLVVNGQDTSIAYPGNYLVVAPKTLRPGLPYAVSYNNLRNDDKSPVAVTLKITDDKNNTVSQVQKSIPAGASETIKFEKIPTSLLEDVTYTLRVTGQSGDKTVFENSQDLIFNKKSKSVFVQTDKAIYKPGSTVHFRVVAVYPDLKPFSGSAVIKITDPNQNVIQQYTNASFDKGVIGKDDSMQLILSDEPPLGDWVIKVVVDDGQTVEKSFSVEKYVLPKFEVVVKPPAFMTIDEDLAVTVSAKYTYGKGVGGPVTLLAEYTYFYPTDQRKLNQTSELDSNGEAVFRFTNAALKEVNLLSSYGYNSIKLTATVTEALTGIQRNGTAEITAYKNRYKIQITKPAETFQPGLDYVLLVAVVDQDNKPLAPGQSRVVNITATSTHAYVIPPPNSTDFVTSRESVTNKILQLDQDGTLAYKITALPEAISIRIEVRYGNNSDLITSSEVIEASKSPTKSYLQITTDQNTVKAGENVVFHVKCTTSLPSLTAQVLTRGYMVYSKNVPVKDNKADITIPTTSEMAPSARLIVYGVKRDNKEIVVGSMDLKVAGLMKNNVSISADPNRAEPGNNVTFTIRASPNSYVALLSVDQSVLLLKSGNDITKEMVESEIAQYDTNPSSSWWGGRRRTKRMICFRCGWWGISGKDAATIFDNSGVFVLTDAFLYREPLPPIYMRSMMYHQPMAYQAMVSEDIQYEADSQSSNIPDVKVRSKFPETWIFSHLLSGSDGTVAYTAEVPDTITSWITSAFAVHDEDGLGVAPETTKVEVFRPFFIRLNLPYSVKRGEKLALQVLIFNYSPQEQSVTVTLDQNENSKFQLVNNPDAGKSNSKPSNKRLVAVSGNGGTGVVYFPLVPTEVGDLKLLVKAVGQNVGDAVENVLIVEAEGYQIFRNKPFVIDLTTNKSWTNTVSLEMLPNVIPGSQKATVSVVGDIMGPVLENIDKLVRMPYGCGEQNMLNFVPNIVVAKYLKATSRLTPALSEKTKRFMEAGYQREMTYQRDDFSYSAFGKSDKAGSTWLTAFVARSFKQAKPFIYVDDDKLAKSLKFLQRQQKENGAFVEHGEVHHKAMQGGSGAGGAPLTAFVFLALLENDIRNAGAQKFLERGVDQLTNDVYSLAIINYALHLANSDLKDKAFRLLEALATEKAGFKYWAQNVTKSEFREPSWYDTPPPVEVEMTSYALLTYLLRGDTSGAVPLVRWLVSKQNSFGGYSSTQDTVIALQALGAYALKTYSPDVASSLSVKSGSFERTLTVNKDNAIVQQSVDIKAFEAPVKLSATGKGVSFGQVSWHYNVPELQADQPFTCDKNVKQTSENEVFVNLCCKYTLAGRSNMALMEVKSPSGYVIDQDKLNKLRQVPDIQRVDLQDADSKANIYFNSIGADKICLNVTNQRVFSVSDQKPSIIKLTDYYSPSKNIQFDYIVEKKATLNDICGGNCWKGEAPH